MRNFVLAALLSAAFATPAQARNGDFYIGGEVGLLLANDSDLSVTPAVGAGSTGAIRLGHDLGFDGGVVAGYDLGPVRLEAEASYRRAGVDTIDSDFTLGSVIVAGERPAGNGDVSALSFMGNVMVDFGNEDRLSFAIGGGAGYARVKYGSVETVAGGAALLDDREWRFAWQALAGARLAVGEHVDLTLRYRFFNAGGGRLVGVGGRAVDEDFSSHSLMAGITFNFW